MTYTKDKRQSEFESFKDRNHTSNSCLAPTYLLEICPLITEGVKVLLIWIFCF